jgi:hypothetical protein
MLKKRWLRILLGFTAVVILVGGGVLFWFTRPHYAWLAFGPQERVRLLLCDRGLWIAVTQFVDGKRSGPVERFRAWPDFGGLTLDDPDGQTTYTLTKPQNYAPPGEPPKFMATVDIQGPLAYRQYCDLGLAAGDPESAPVAHFHGPLTAGAVTANWKLPEGLALERGDSPTTLRAFVGTMDAARGCWVTVNSHDGENEPRFPPEVRPEVEITFAAQSEGQPPIVERYALDQVCCGCVFYAPVRVPELAGDGFAVVTFSFPSWTAAHVASSTVTLPIAPPRAAATPVGVAEAGQ